MNSEQHIKTFNDMKFIRLAVYITLALMSYSCVSIEQLSRHDFDSGYYRLKIPEAKPEKVYVDLKDDSIVVYNVSVTGKTRVPDTSATLQAKLGSITSGSSLYHATFVNSSPDFDLSTVLARYRPGSQGVPNQLSSSLNAVLYLGMRRDFYMIKTHLSPLKAVRSNIRHIGFDAGLFAGLGITPVNPTVTNFQITREYDGMVFQKGIAAFFTIEKMSVGIGLGFDNLLDNNSKYWVFNQKPWIGLILGIANF
jgi:hypothetical protein